MKEPRKRIKDIFSKTVSDRTEAVWRIMREKNKKSGSRLLIAAACALAVAAVFLILILSGVFSAPEEGKRGVTADDLIDKHGSIYVAVVFSELDDWGREVSEQVSDRLSGIEGLTASVMTDSEFSDPGREPFPGERNSVSGEKTDESGYCLVVNVGYTSISPGNYLEECLRLGTDGYEIFHRSADGKLPEAVFITAFDGSSAERAASKFTEYFLSADNFTRIFGRMYLTKTGKDMPGRVVFSSSEGDFSGVLTVARPLRFL